MDQKREDARGRQWDSICLSAFSAQKLSRIVSFQVQDKCTAMQLSTCVSPRQQLAFSPDRLATHRPEPSTEQQSQLQLFKHQLCMSSLHVSEVSPGNLHLYLQDYESVDVGEKQYTNQRAAPELVVADAPNAPRFGGKGLQGNATYQLQDQDTQPKTEQHEVRKSRLLLHLAISPETFEWLSDCQPRIANSAGPDVLIRSSNSARSLDKTCGRRFEIALYPFVKLYNAKPTSPKTPSLT